MKITKNRILLLGFVESNGYYSKTISINICSNEETKTTMCVYLKEDSFTEDHVEIGQIVTSNGIVTDDNSVVVINHLKNIKELVNLLMLIGEK